MPKLLFSKITVSIRSETISSWVKVVPEGQNVFLAFIFYPGFNPLKYVEMYTVSVSKVISKRIFCLPLYFGKGEIIIEENKNHVNKIIRR